MIINATFWVAVSFFIFVGLLIYFKIPQKITSALVESINSIKNEVEDAEKLKEEAINILSDYEKKISNSKNEIASPRLHRYPHPPHKAEVLQVVFGVLRGTP